MVPKGPHGISPSFHPAGVLVSFAGSLSAQKIWILGTAISTTCKLIKSMLTPQNFGNKNSKCWSCGRKKKHIYPPGKQKISHQSERKLIFLTAFVLGYVGSQDWLVVSTPFEKYESKWESSPGRGENKKYFMLSCLRTG